MAGVAGASVDGSATGGERSARDPTVDRARL